MFLFKRIVARQDSLFTYAIITSMEFQRDKWWLMYSKYNISVKQQILNQADRINKSLTRQLFRKPSDEVLNRYILFCSHIISKREERERLDYINKMEEEVNKLEKLGY
jgi:hypothetical protein